MSVLKRTYYLYAPTVEEAKKWVDSLISTSYLLNRSRPRSLGYSPAVQVALEAIGNQQRSMPPVTQPPESHKLPSPTPPPPESSSMDESNQDENFHIAIQTNICQYLIFALICHLTASMAAG